MGECKTKVMHVGKVYLGSTFSEGGKIDKEFEERKKSGDTVAEVKCVLMMSLIRRN